ncbi:hypothetical protein CRG98_029068, partial [Punica granatum]
NSIHETLWASMIEQPRLELLQVTFHSQKKQEDYDRRRDSGERERSREYRRYPFDEPREECRERERERSVRRKQTPYGVINVVFGGEASGKPPTARGGPMRDKRSPWMLPLPENESKMEGQMIQCLVFQRRIQNMSCILMMML